jgi:LysM domain-containing protein
MISTRRRASRAAVVCLVSSASVVVPRAAAAQAGPAPASTEGAAPPAGAPPAEAPRVAPPAVGPFGYGNPQSPNGTIGGGNATESSAHPVTGDSEDSFDLGPGAHGGGGNPGVAHGDDTGPIFIGRPTYSGELPDTHVVRRGDTLWGLCDFYFQNPYQWPRLWSYNPQLKNPHWIYPGDEVRLKEGAATDDKAAGKAPLDTNKMSLVDRRRQVPNGTVFLRDQGWLRDESDDVWGNLTGSTEDKMFLSDLDEVYLTLEPGHQVRLGQELSVFRPRKTAAAGQIVQILGTVRIDQVDAQNHLARGKIVESLDVIERGAFVGPLERKFAMVAPNRNAVDVQAHVLASLHPNEFFGQNQVIFIDKGDAAGLKPGNRLFVVRRGDAWRRSLVTPGAGYRVSADDERPMPPMENTPGARRDDDKYPDEVVAELRVLSVKKDSAVCIVTQSRLEIELNDLAVARKGY